MVVYLLEILERRSWFKNNIKMMQRMKNHYYMDFCYYCCYVYHVSQTWSSMLCLISIFKFSISQFTHTWRGYFLSTSFKNSSTFFSNFSKNKLDGENPPQKISTRHSKSHPFLLSCLHCNLFLSQFKWGGNVVPLPHFLEPLNLIVTLSR